MTEERPMINRVVHGLLTTMCHTLTESGTTGHMVAAIARDELVGAIVVNGWMSNDERDEMVRHLANWVRAVDGDTVVTAMDACVNVPDCDDHPDPADDPESSDAIVTTVYERSGRWEECVVVKYHRGDQGEVSFDPPEMLEVEADAFTPLGAALLDRGPVISRDKAEQVLRAYGCLPSAS